MAQAIGDAGIGALSVGFLGPLRVVRHGAPLVLGGRQQKAVLGVLASEANSVISVSQLAEAVWGEQVGSRTVAAVQTYVSRLREVLEPDRPRGVRSQVLSSEPGGYRLCIPDDDIDAVVFERRVQLGRALLEERRYAAASAELSAALAMWRGPVLADLADYEFAKLAAVRLDEVRLLALEDRIEADIALGRHREVAGELDALIVAHPLREGLHAKRMVARYRSGRQGEALSGYQEFRTLLADELGIDPSPELQTLYRAVLTRETSLDPTAAVATSERLGAERRAAGPEPRPGNRPSPRRRRRWRLAVLAGTAVAALVIGATAVLLVQSRSRTLPAFPPNSLGRIDSRGGLRSVVRIGQSPSGVAYGAGSLWVANSDDDTVSRVDPDSDRLVQTIGVHGSPNAVAVLNDDVWVTDGGAGMVSRINAPDNDEVQRISVGNQPTAIVAGPSGVWVANSGDDTIQRLDPITGVAGNPIPVGAYPDGLAVGSDSVWVANGRDGTVSPVDFSGHAGSPIVVGAGPKGLALTADSLWVANSLDLSVTRIGLNDARVRQTILVGDGPHSVVAAGKAVWVSNEFDGTVTRIDSATGTVGRRIPTGSSPHGMVMIGSSAWVTTGSFANAEHKGGTLTVEQDWVPGGPSIDFYYYYYDQPTLAMLYDGLVALRRSGGAAGLTLVPDLALALPHATDGGRTYTFTLRKGIHYSNGAEVRPADIRWGLLRALRGPAATYYASVLGAAACIASASRCNEVARGLMIDERTWQVTFRLSAPDPEFLYKLSSFVYATPPTVPIGGVARPDPDHRAVHGCWL